MSTDPIPPETGQRTAELREARLHEIRREAETKGRVEAIGIRPAGAPFPVASVETGYYGLPLLKEPAWTWQIPIYFFAGGAAGSAALLGVAARWVGNDQKLASDCRLIAAAGTAASSALLISDLGRPARFLTMMRVFKPQSAMSMGAWALAGFGTFSAAAFLAEKLHSSIRIPLLAPAGDLAEILSAIFGLQFSNYTGVLIGATAIPVWNENVSSLPLHFGMSGLSSSVSILELMGHDNRALNTLGIGSSAIETAQDIKIEVTDKPVLEPLKRGKSGFITRMGGILSGPVPLALRVAAAFEGKRRARQLRSVAAASSIAGSMLTRIAWVYAGHVSARDWRLPLQLEGSKSPRTLHPGTQPPATT